jgi:ubiquinone/menaquinone biosynthesis C-methylase UbiE
MSSISFDRAADYYDATRGYSAETADAIGAALFQAAGARPGSHLLELGIGTGRIAIPLLAHGANVTGVDISPRMVERLRGNLAARRAEQPDLPWGTLDVQIADMTALPFAAETLDAVLAVHVFHLVLGWQRALDEALRVLRRGGALLIGQDRHPGAESGVIQDQWAAIVRELGGGSDLDPVGAAGFRGVLEELRGRGLAVDETRPVTWTTQRTPREVLTYVAGRGGSSTWRVPDDIFAASIQRLEAWAGERYGDSLDAPHEEQAEFVIARVVKPA